jgi:hypothetical protein
MALARAASAAARPYKPKQRHRLRYAFEFMTAALLGDKQAGDLALNLDVTRNLALNLDVTRIPSASPCIRAAVLGASP